MASSSAPLSTLLAEVNSDRGRDFACAIRMSAEAFARECKSALNEKPVVLEACVALHENREWDFYNKLDEKGLGPAHARVLAFFLARNTRCKKLEYVVESIGVGQRLAPCCGAPMHL